MEMKCVASAIKMFVAIDVSFLSGFSPSLSIWSGGQQLSFPSY